ncbi:helix-turn-helix domain-containing protein [Streptomyces sp. NBC_00470]|uniref:MmyB family transcriptional regulator n=1 Tax=Streptomyces sp. NBC_00470 TaxID=2975753 RepID=UPI0030E1AE41
MVIDSLGETVEEYRNRASLTPSRVAGLAGISVGEYLAIELGTAWPGADTVEAVLNILHVPSEERPRLAEPGAPLDQHLRLTLHNYDIPALIVDSEWRTVEANRFARALLPGAARPGWNLMRWVLVEGEARQRLANWYDVAITFASALRGAIDGAPRNEELLALRDDAGPLGHVEAPSYEDCPDGQILIWQSPNGTHPISACRVTVPSGRPDLQQVMFVPRVPTPAAMPAEGKTDSSAWHGLVLADLLSCGLCSLALAESGTLQTSYSCATGCLAGLSAAELESRVVEQVLRRALSRQVVHKLGLAQESISAGGGELKLNVPVSAKHALDQWKRSMSTTQRRSILTTTLRSVIVHPASGQKGNGAVDLTYSWQADF